MKLLSALFAALLCAIHAFGQTVPPAYDQHLADSLGADEYGMKSYWLVILKTGPAKIEDPTVRDSLFAGHMHNIQQMAAAGKLVVAGPLGKNDSQFRGIFILTVSTVEEAQALLAQDPTIQAHIFEAEIMKWYGSAALPMYLPYHAKIEKAKP